MVRKSSDSLRNTLAENVKAFRKENGFSQEGLAAHCGLHRTYIGSIERNERNATLSTLEVLASALGVTVVDLLSKPEKESVGIMQALRRLTPAQRRWVESTIITFGTACKFDRAADSDLVTDAVLASLGDRLLSHHASSRQALSNDRFEFAFEAALNSAGIPARLVNSRTNRGHDIEVRGVPICLKTEAAANINDESIHVSKWMELGRGEWKLSVLRDLFLEHMRSYDRILTLRRLKNVDVNIRYELVEIPKALLLEAVNCTFDLRTHSRQKPKPGYGYVKDTDGRLKYSLYFDGGTERKLQIKHLRKDLCKVHATWTFGSSTAQQPLTS